MSNFKMEVSWMACCLRIFSALLQGLYSRPVQIRDWGLEPAKGRVLSFNSGLVPAMLSLVFGVILTATCY